MVRKASTIRRLPDELRKEIDRLLADGRYTLSDVTAHMKSLGADVSRSAVARYSQDFERIAEDIRLAREMANAIGREIEAVPDGDSGRLVIESLQALLLRGRMQVAKGDSVDVDELAKLSRAAKDLATALKSNVSTEMAIRKQAAEDAAAAAGEVMTSQGISGATVEAIKASILGISARAKS